MNVEGKASQAVSNYHGIFLEGLRKVMKNRSQDSLWAQYEAAVITTLLEAIVYFGKQYCSWQSRSLFNTLL